jgi:hypothetical protein
MIERRKNNLQAMNGDYLMTDRMVAELALVSVRTVHHWRLTGQLPFVKFGRHPRVWYSVFLRIFQNPLSQGIGVTDTMLLADGDIRRKA